MNDQLEHHLYNDMFGAAQERACDTFHEMTSYLDAVYGEGYARENPVAVAALMNFALIDWTTHLKIEGAKDDRS